MKAYSIVEFGQPLREREVEIPRPVGAEVIVKVQAAGVCHSDLHIWEGGYDLGRGRRLSVTDRGVTLPFTLGHENAGEAVALGPEAGDAELGQNYLVYPWIGCGECPTCRAGRENQCAKSCAIGVNRDGGYAEYLRVPHARYLIPIGDLDPAQLAPFACSGVTAYSAIKKLGDTPFRTPVVIFGAGGVGLMAVSLLRALGAVGAVVVDIDEAKRAAALEAGALAALDGRAPDLIAQIQSACGGSCEAVIDLVGSPETTQAAFDALSKGGSLVLVGLFGGLATWSLALIAAKGISILGNLVGNLEQTRELVELVRQGKIDPIPVDRRPLSAASDTLMGLRDGRVFGRAVLCPDCAPG